jgi:prevent-host-death family protein
VDLVHGIDSLTNFKRDTITFLKRLQRSKEPLVLTINGKAKLVVQDASSYQALMELIDQLRTIAAVKEGLGDVKAGRTRPAREALEELGQKAKVRATKSK